MVDHMITGGGGVQLHVREAGNPHGRPVLFLHGYSQAFLSWYRQLAAHGLGGPLRLLAMDLRGHGLSDKPPGVYGESRLWADDVHAVVDHLGLDRPVLVGWSYGGLVICDYLRFYPDTPLRGVQFVCAWTTLGTAEAQKEISSAVFALVPGLTSGAVETAVDSVQGLLDLAFEKPLPPETHFRTLGFNLAVPPNVRADLLARTLDNDDVVAGLHVPVLVTQGAQDRILDPEASRRLADRIPGATLSVYPRAGHAPFVDNPARFNRELRSFVLGR